MPAKSEWLELTHYLGSPDENGGIAGGKMKESGSSHWGNSNIGGDNESGFSALPGGHNSIFLGYFAGFWSGTFLGHPDFSTQLWTLELRADGRVVSYIDLPKWFGISVRCIKDKN